MDNEREFDENPSVETGSQMDRALVVSNKENITSRDTWNFRNI